MSTAKRDITRRTTNDQGSPGVVRIDSRGKRGYKRYFHDILVEMTSNLHIVRQPVSVGSRWICHGVGCVGSNHISSSCGINLTVMVNCYGQNIVCNGKVNERTQDPLVISKYQIYIGAKNLNQNQKVLSYEYTRSRRLF
jgi:hypothetical protein